MCQFISGWEKNRRKKKKKILFCLIVIFFDEYNIGLEFYSLLTNKCVNLLVDGKKRRKKKEKIVVLISFHSEDYEKK